MGNTQEMSSHDVAVPAVVRWFFDGRDLDQKQHLAVYLLTVGGDSWPHAAMVSAGELLLSTDGCVRLGLWPESRTTANVRRTGRAVLLLVLDQQSFRIRLTVRETDGPSMTEPLTFFAGRVDEVVVDHAAYAVLDSGVRFTLHDADDTLRRWRDTIDVLRSLQPSPADHRSVAPTARTTPPAHDRRRSDQG